jgi:mannose/fructose/N-acetylgalactosamine-specific phosphotransferase system component IID
MPGFGGVLARLFMFQAAWGYERMGGIGFAHSIEPALRALEGGPAGAAYRQALAREAAFFNAHPYFAALAVGAAARAELEGETPERIARLREALCGPLGSVGDRLIWAAWLPTCVALALIVLALGGGIAAAVVFLLLYNLVHVYTRVWALRAGWSRGLKVAGALTAPGLRLANAALPPVAAFLLGASLPVVFGWQVAAASWPVVLTTGAGAGLFAAVVRLAELKISGVALASVALVATWLAGLAWR